jgi:hypothetical protein
MKSRMTLELDAYLEALVNAEKDVDQVVVEVLDKNKYNAVMLMYQNLRKTSETWTEATAKTLFVEGPQLDGNYIYIELGAHIDSDPSALYKEYGKPRQAAEPFLRPTLLYYRKGGLKQAMQAVLERFGVSA